MQPETSIATGRSFAMFADPAGNTIGLTLATGQPAAPISFSGKPNPVTLVAISTPDVPGTRRFYEQMFGLRLKEESQTRDIDETLREVTRTSGKTFQHRTPLTSGGAYAFFTDPSGNTLGLLERP
ncbi:VOC family protein [Nocardia sp. NPDC052566]|uniref:VOC family protein n=1 Tax=Nocardia sp. NPDC052566 TaxID=3364330 RepID=UPI0037C74FFB